jgi:tetratricopeptide (TPR) repeat protein
MEAKALYLRGLVLAEQVNDYAQISLASTYLALVLQDIGDMKQARRYIRQALTVNRHLNVSSCVGPTLIACASMRLARFWYHSATDELGGSYFQPGESGKRVLMRVWKTVERAFALGELDKEIRIEGELMLSHILLLLGKATEARYQAMQALDGALQCELMRSAALALRVLGDILAVQAQYEQAGHYFQQALQQFHRYGMRLEYARTLRCYGRMLASSGAEEQQYQQGLSYLREARSICIACQAACDLQHIEGDLVLLSDTFTPQHAW